MQKINVLDKHLAELIAAGEVVERPSSVVKELIENSVDAGSKKIKIEIKHGGIKYIKISDNGSGIYRDDVKNAFLRHATSKLKSENDLESIGTLGFRGEALASICAVSKVELITKTQDEECGTRYINQGGEDISLEDIGCGNGTTIIIRDLFYNTPARMKFLKTDIAEANSIAGVIDRIALSHPEISFKFIRDGKEVLNTPGDEKISSSIYAVYGREFFYGMMPIDYELNGVKINGFISKPVQSRASRSMQHFFINGRYVKTRTASVALEEAFKGTVMVGKHPYCVVYIKLPYGAVDVNVHPAKIEVRFINEKMIFDALYYGVKNSLIANDKSKLMEFSDCINKNVSTNKIEINTPLKDIKVEKIDNVKDNLNNEKIQEVKSQTPILKTISIPINNVMTNKILNNPFDGELFTNAKLGDAGFDRLNKKAINIECSPESVKSFDLLNLEDKSNKELKDVADKKDVEEKNEDALVLNKNNNEIKLENYSLKKNENYRNNIDYKIIGEAFNCYIIVQEIGGELLFIDKHAAHERFIYEKLKKEEKISDSQVLLEPLAITLEKDEYSALIENLNLMEKSGYVIEDFGMGTIIVRSVPSYVEHKDIKDSLIEIAGYIIKNKKSLNTDYLEWLYHNMACRAAIKAGKSSSYMEIQDLVKKVYNNPDIRYCPHGRPVFIALKKSDIEKQFGRM